MLPAMVFWKRPSSGGAATEPASALLDAVRREMPDADDTTQRIVAALAGVLGSVAYADRDYRKEEEAVIRAALGRVEGLGELAVETVCHVLRDEIRTISMMDSHVWPRELKALTTRPLRVEILDLLVDLAAADEEISMAETQLLRRITESLGLTQDDYVHAQSRHRDKLSVLGRRDG